VNAIVNDVAVRNMLLAEARKAGSQSALARKVRCSRQMMSAVLKGQKQPTEAMLRLIGLERLVVYMLVSK
jgi:transcriptional regulator with XRE-family HTH domain